MKRWTEQEIAMLKELYPDMKNQIIAQHIGKSTQAVAMKGNLLGLSKSEAFKEEMRKISAVMGVKNGFQKGNKAWNKGVKGATSLKCFETTFKKGNIPKNHRPVGSTRFNEERNFMEIKIAEPKKWVSMKHYIWLQAGNSIPDGYKVALKDGDPNNVVLENLELVTFGNLLARNNKKEELPNEISQLQRLVNKIKKTLKNQQNAKK